MASIRSKGAAFEVRVQVGGRSLSRCFHTLREVRYFAAKVEVDPTSVRGRKHAPQAVLTLSEALQRYAEQVSIHHKGVKQELLVIGHLPHGPALDDGDVGLGRIRKKAVLSLAPERDER